MKYIVYLTVNLKSKINGKARIYVGVHQTENPDIFDGYLACGCWANQPSTYKYPKTPIQYAIKKYGPEAFKRIILFIYDTEDEAYDKEAEIVTESFIKLDHVYNACLGGKLEDRNIPLYQFDINGNLLKKWKNSREAGEFYGYPITRFQGPKVNKCLFLDSFWSTTEKINITEYSIKPLTNYTYLYSKNGKLLKEFESQAQCAEYLNYDKGELSRAIKYQKIIQKQYYVSNSIVDEFIPKPKNSFIDKTYYVYNVNNDFVGKCIGKELMNLIGLHSWDKISTIFSHNKGWYKDFYISFEEIDKVPVKRVGNGICVDVYDKYGNFIEQIKSIKEVKEKYHIPTSKIRNIQQGDRYFGDYIFKYSK